MGVKYEIDQLGEFYRGICKNYPYVVVITLPYCTVPGPFRIVTKTVEQARAFKHRKSITKIVMWPYKVFKDEKN